MRDYQGPLSVFLQAPTRADDVGYVARVLGPDGHTRCYHNGVGWVTHSREYHSCRCDEFEAMRSDGRNETNAAPRDPAHQEAQSHR